MAMSGSLANTITAASYTTTIVATSASGVAVGWYERQVMFSCWLGQSRGTAIERTASRGIGWRRLGNTSRLILGAVDLTCDGEETVR